MVIICSSDSHLDEPRDIAVASNDIIYVVETQILVY